MKNTLLLIILITFPICKSFSQVDHKRITPPNPNVASLMKAALTPVTEFAGLPNVSIPLYTIVQDNINVPIYLSYHTGGIQVGEESGSVGLGWALNAGGVISRTLNGSDDFDLDHWGYLIHNEQHPDPIIIGSYFNPDHQRFIVANDNCEFPVNDVLTNFSVPEQGLTQNDYMPDTFNFNFNGYSGSFVLKRDGSVLMLEKKGLKVIPDYSRGKLNVNFTIYTEDGTKYFFEDKAMTIMRPDEMSTRQISTWFLTKITTTLGNDISFIYEDKGDMLPLRTFIQYYQVRLAHNSCNVSACGSTGFVNMAAAQINVDDIYLAEIQFSTGKVKFNYSDDHERQDIPSAFFLKNIETFDTFSNVIKKYDFNYDYFGSATPGPTDLQNGDFANDIFYGGSSPKLNLRLRLDSVIENDIKTTNFEYYISNRIPNKTSTSQDYWGFYNGIINPTSFIPFFTDPNNTGYSVPILAKRYPVVSAAKIFSLKKITYPTKGATEFDYELNTYKAQSYINAPPPVTSPKYVYVSNGGGNTTMTKTFSPNIASVLEVDFNFAIRGTSVSPINSNTFDFNNDMYLEIRRVSDNYLISRKTFLSDHKFDFIDNGKVYYSVETTIDISMLQNAMDSDYVITAYFNDHNGTIFGYTSLEINWEEVEQSPTEDFSLGGGLRVKSIIDYENNGKQLRKRSFNYHYKEDVNDLQVEKTYGKIKTIPNFDLDKKTLYHIILDMGTAPMPFLVGYPLPLNIANAASNNSFSKSLGSYVGYDQVEVIQEDLNGNSNGKNVYKFYNEQDFYGRTFTIPNIDDYHSFPPIRISNDGLMYEHKIYSRNNINTYKLINKTEFNYLVNGLESSNFGLSEQYQNTDYVLSAIKELELHPSQAGIYSCNYGFLKFQFRPYYSNLIQQTSQVETVYDSNGENPIITQQNFFYDNNVNHFEKTRIETIDSEGLVIKTQIYYPDDIPNSSFLTGGNLSTFQMIAIDSIKANKQHKIAIPIQTETYKEEDLLSIERTIFKDFGERKLDMQHLILPEKIQTSKTSEDLKDRIIYHKYDNNGNPTEVSKKEGAHIVYIWGYNKTQPIAKIENVTYQDLETAIMTISDARFNTLEKIQVISNSDDNRVIGESDTGEGLLRKALNELRNVPSLHNAQVTTFTYDPLIGVTSITDPRGETVYYHYDFFNRLQFVKDKEGNILSKNEYNYKN